MKAIAWAMLSLIMLLAYSLAHVVRWFEKLRK